MIETGVDAAINQIVCGPGMQPVLHLLEAAQNVTRAPIAYLAVLRDNEVQLIASGGVPFVPFGSIARAEPGADLIFDGAMLVEDLCEHPVLSKSPLVTRAGGWRWFAATLVPLPMLKHRIALCCADPRLKVERPHGLVTNLQSIVTGIADTLTMLSIIGEQRRKLHDLDKEANSRPGDIDVVRKDQSGPFAAHPSEPAAVTMRFLISTLIGHRRVLARNGVVYHALARWRAAIKPWQIDALRALKTNLRESWSTVSRTNSRRPLSPFMVVQALMQLSP